jgi:hypothetical protein
MKPRDTRQAAADLLAMGFDESDIQTAQDEDSVPVYPEAADPLRLFSELITQWRMGPSGPTGLDHARRDTEARRLGLRTRRKRRAFDGLAVMESEALAYMCEQAKKAMTQ